MSNSSAVEPFLGYMYQSLISLYYFLEKGITNTELVLSIEKFDDISFDKDGLPKELIQTKHHVKRAGSLSNLSTDLWKSIYNWIQEVDDNNLDYKNTIFTIITTSKTNEDSASNYLIADKSVRDPVKAIEILENSIKESESKSLQPYFHAFNNLDQDTKKVFFTNIVVIDESPLIHEVKSEIKKLLKAYVRHNHVDRIYSSLESFWLELIINTLSGIDKKPISYMRFHAYYNDLRDQYTSQSLPIDFPLPLDNAEEQLTDQQKFFIKQLELISLGRPNIIKAIKDYYRVYKLRSMWLRDGEIFEDELKAYEQSLSDEWEREFNYMLAEKKNEKDDAVLEKAGFDFYRMFDTQKVRDSSFFIRPNTQNSFIFRGFLHSLSNNFQIGWHPEFETRLLGVFQKTHDNFIQENE